MNLISFIHKHIFSNCSNLLFASFGVCFGFKQYAHLNTLNLIAPWFQNLEQGWLQWKTSTPTNFLDHGNSLHVKDKEYIYGIFHFGITKIIRFFIYITLFIFLSKLYAHLKAQTFIELLETIRPQFFNILCILFGNWKYLYLSMSASSCEIIVLISAE